MDKIIIVLLVLLAVVGVIFFILIKKKDKDEIYTEVHEEIKFNQYDINSINNVNDRVITGKRKESKINIPDFDKSKPIGYKDLSHIESTYGDRVASSNNRNIK